MSADIFYDYDYDYYCVPIILLYHTSNLSTFSCQLFPIAAGKIWSALPYSVIWTPSIQAWFKL